MRFKLSNKIQGVLSVSLANLLSLGISLLTSFILPLFLSVKEYGYWQLFVMYSSYVGFFSFGFNDGVHLHYAGADYDERYFAKFSSFRKMLSWLTVVETGILILSIYLFVDRSSEKYLMLILCVLNIIPVVINGYFTYINQSAMRFKQYSRAHIINRLLFLSFMLVLLFGGSRVTMHYIIAYTIAQYIVIVYNYFSSREIFTHSTLPLNSMKQEINRNFRNGFALMIGSLLNGSIILASRMLVETQYGIEEFSMFSFALHTLVVASQFIAAVSSVFYPIMKRCSRQELEDIYINFDNSTTILSGGLLISYYAAALLINLLYHSYTPVLGYLYVVYPLFIFQCKSNLLIINYFKVQEKPKKLILINICAILINAAVVFVFNTLFHSVVAIAVAILVGYVLWYFICQIIIYRENGWKIKVSMFADLILTALFIFINLLVYNVVENSYGQLLTGVLVYLGMLLLLLLIYRKKILDITHQTAIILKD